jgi:hypothetical protein
MALPCLCSNFVGKTAEIFLLAVPLLRKIQLYPANLGEDGEIRATLEKVEVQRR